MKKKTCFLLRVLILIHYQYLLHRWNDRKTCSNTAPFIYTPYNVRSLIKYRQEMFRGSNRFTNSWAIYKPLKSSDTLRRWSYCHLHQCAGTSGSCCILCINKYCAFANWSRRYFPLRCFRRVYDSIPGYFLFLLKSSSLGLVIQGFWSTRINAEFDTTVFVSPTPSPAIVTICLPANR